MPALKDIVKDNLKLICTTHCTVGRQNGAPKIETRYGMTLSFDEQAIKLVKQTVDKIRSERSEAKLNFSPNYLEEELFKIVFSCQPLPSGNIDTCLHSEIATLIRRLKTSTPWVFFIPVLNLRFDNFKKIEIGRVSFYDVNLKSVRYLRSKFKTKLGSQLSKKDYQEFMQEKISVIAVVKVKAGEKEMGSNKALAKVEKSLNIIRLFNFTNKFGAQRELSISSGTEGIYWKNLANNDIGSSHRSLSSYPYFPFIITKQHITLMRKKGNLVAFSKLLTSSPPNEVQSKILTSLHWYGLAVKDDLDIDRFVKLVISLESLILNTGDEPKKYLLADRSAFILGTDEKSRKEIANLVANAYSVRSSIVHEGLFEISNEQTFSLIMLLRSLIFKLLKLSVSISSLEEISDKIRDIKFQSPLLI